MLSNASTVFHSGNTTYNFPSVYKYDKTVSEITTSSLTVKHQTVLIIFQDKTPVDLNSLNVSVGKDYFMFTGDTKPYTVTSFVNAMYGSSNMKHLEFILE